MIKIIVLFCTLNVIIIQYNRKFVKISCQKYEKNAQKNRAKNFFEAFCTVWVKKLLNHLHIELIDSLMKRNVVVFEAENGLDALRNLEFEVCVSLAAFDGNADLSVTGIDVTVCVV